jgi:hypothetical protein
MAAYAICWGHRKLPEFHYNLTQSHVVSSNCSRPTIFQNPEGTLCTHFIKSYCFVLYCEHDLSVKSFKYVQAPVSLNSFVFEQEISMRQAPLVDRLPALKGMLTAHANQKRIRAIMTQLLSLNIPISEE